MKKIFLIALIFLFICGISLNAEADLVYTTTDGNLGLIEYSETEGFTISPKEYVSKKENPIVTSYLLNGSAKVMLIEPDVDDIADDKFYVFNASDLTKPENSSDLFFDGIRGTTSVVTAVNADYTSVFLSSSEGAVAEYRAGNTEPRNYYNYSEVTSCDTTAVKSLISNERLYVLFDRYDSDYDEHFYEILRFDGLLEKNSSFASFDLGFMPNDFAVTYNRIVLAAYDGGIRRFTGKTASDDLTISGMDIQSIYIDTKNSFYFIMGNESVTKLSRYTSSGGIEEIYSRDESIYNGTYPKMVYDSKNKMLAASMCGGVILVTNSNNERVASDFITNTELGGNIYSLAFLGVSTTTNNTSSSSSSGCNAMSLSFTGILALSLIAKFRNKK